LNWEKEKRLGKDTILFIFFTVVWMGFIFFMSSQPGDSSSLLSGKVAAYITTFFNKLFRSNPPQGLIDLIMEGLLVRKAAHFTEFAILGFLVLVTLKKLKIPRFPLISGLICILYAVSDEFHQKFVPGRYPSFGDVMIDVSGAVFAILLCLIIIKIRDKGTCACN